MVTKEYLGRQQIIAKMLNIVNESDSKGTTKTSIMYKAFLSYAQLKEYLSFLLESGLLMRSLSKLKAGVVKNLYTKITEKGIRLLQISNEIESIVGLD